MDNPTLSVCIPSYKRPQDLERCLSSLVNQKLFDDSWIELIICDDAPHQPVTEVVKKFQKKYGKQKIKYFLNEQNLGFEKNILKCIDKATNKYIFFLTDDDCFTPHTLEKIKNLLLTHSDIDFFTSTYLTQHENGEIFGDYKISQKSRYILKESADEALIFGICNDLSGKCFKKECFSVSGYSRHFGSMYPHLYALGEMILKYTTYYEVEPLFIQTIGNFTYWSYPADHCIGGMFKIIEDLGRLNSSFVPLAKKKIILNCPYIIYLNLTNPKRLFIFLGYIWRYKILTSPKNWVYLLEGSLKIFNEKIASFIPKKDSDNFIR